MLELPVDCNWHGRATRVENMWLVGKNYPEPCIGSNPDALEGKALASQMLIRLHYILTASLSGSRQSCVH